jgi:adenosylmethionine-8-amino-7-oxononanoate aminotransferase
MIQSPFSIIGTPPQKIQSAIGHYITLSSGEVMFDCQAGGSANMLGHNISELTKIRSESFCSDWDLSGPHWETLDTKLKKILGADYNLFIPQLTGSDAVDTAIRCAWSINSGKIIVRPNSYHSGSITGWQLSDRTREFTPSWSKCNWFIEADSDDDANDIRRLLKRGGCSAILVDALTWSNGSRFVSPDYWHEVAVLAKQHGVPLIVDEVLTGFGKFGVWSYFVNTLRIMPDMLIFGKNMTAGHEALSMVCISDEYADLLKGKWLASGNTKSFNECGAAITSAHIDIIQRDLIFENVNKNIIPYIKEIEQEVNKSGKAKCKAHGVIFEIDCGSDRANYKFHLKMKKLGFWQRFWKTSYFHVFYNTDNNELNLLKEAILKSI